MRTRILLNPPRRPTREDTLCESLRMVVPKPLVCKLSRNYWILEETLQDTNTIVSLRRALDRDKQYIRNLGIRVRFILDEDRSSFVAEAGKLVGTLLISTPPDKVVMVLHKGIVQYIEQPSSIPQPHHTITCDSGAVGAIPTVSTPHSKSYHSRWTPYLFMTPSHQWKILSGW